MTVETVTVTWTEQDIGQAGLNGTVRIVPSGIFTIGGVDYNPVPKIYPITSSTGHTDPPILALDNPGLIPALPNCYYTISTLIPGLPAEPFTAQVLFANGASQTLAFLRGQQVFPVAPPSGPFMPLGGGQFAGGVSPGGGSLTDAATLTIDATAGNDFTVLLTQNTLLATPLNPVDKQRILIQAVQGGPGGWLLSYSAAFAFLTNPGAPVPLLGTAPGARNYLLFRYDAGLEQWVLLAFL